MRGPGGSRRGGLQPGGRAERRSPTAGPGYAACVARGKPPRPGLSLEHGPARRGVIGDADLSRVVPRRATAGLFGWRTESDLRRQHRVDQTTAAREGVRGYQRRLAGELLGNERARDLLPGELHPAAGGICATGGGEVDRRPPWAPLEVAICDFKLATSAGVS